MKSPPEDCLCELVKVTARRQYIQVLTSFGSGIETSLQRHSAACSKNVNLDDEAVAALEAHRHQGESYSKVIKRKIAPPIRTFGDLEKALNQIDGPILDLDLLDTIRRTARRSERR